MNEIRTNAIRNAARKANASLASDRLSNRSAVRGLLHKFVADEINRDCHETRLTDADISLAHAYFAR